MKVLLLVFILVLFIENTFSQFTPITTPEFPGTGVSYDQKKICFVDKWQGYFSAEVYFSPSSGSEIDFWQTTDGGETWTRKQYFYSENMIVNRLLFPINKDTFITAYQASYFDHLQRVSNNCSVFTEYSLWPSFELEPRAVSMLDNDIFFLTAKEWGNTEGIFSNLYRLEGTNATKIYDCKEDTLILNKSVFVTMDVGFLICFRPVMNDYVVRKTTDGGQTWQNSLTGSIEITDISPFSSSVWIMTCADGYIYRTDDGGESWVGIQLTPGNKLNCLSFINDSVGYCGGLNGSFAVTYNRGMDWQIIPFDATISQLYMIEPGFGYLCSQGTAYKYEIETDAQEIKPINWAKPSPNPTSGIVKLEFCYNLDDSLSVYLINSMGQVLLSFTKTENQMKIDLSSYPSGLYFIILSDGKDYADYKIIKI